MCLFEKANKLLSRIMRKCKNYQYQKKGDISADSISLYEMF